MRDGLKRELSERILSIDLAGDLCNESGRLVVIVGIIFVVATRFILLVLLDYILPVFRRYLVLRLLTLVCGIVL